MAKASRVRPSVWKVRDKRPGEFTIFVAVSCFDLIKIEWEML